MIRIEQVASADVPQTRDFVLDARAALFPKLNASGMPADLAQFEQTYIQGEGCFLIARQNGRIVASIGYVPYDHRFTQLDYRGLKVVEVVRLFVLPPCRRSGVARALYDALKTRAVEAGVELMYLHTHPFLPGAIEFWRRQGFTITDVEDDPVWQTTHMQCRLP